MRALVKAIPALLLALLVAAVACKSGGGSNDSSSNGPAGDAAVSNAIEALGQSAEDFQESVDSLQGEMSMEMSADGIAFGMQGDFAYQSPDQMHMTMHFNGGEDSIIDLSQMGNIEILLLGDTMYMKMPLFGGWVEASLSDLGADAEQFEELLSDQSPFDYSHLIESLSGNVQVQDLGDEDLDGGTYRHYRIESDFASLMEALAGAFGGDTSAAGIPMDGISGPVVMDVWLDTETLLPHKLEAEGSFSVAELTDGAASGDMTFAMTMVISEYNGHVTMPEPPADAKDFSELGEDLFGEFEEE